jgi:Mrp family chromosome partitioning ATPase
MSSLFDPSQRSGFKRSRVDLSALPTATGLLQLSKRQATVEPEIPFPFPAIPQSAPAAGVGYPPNGNRSDPFRQFQSLWVSVPPQSRLVCLTDTECLAAEKFRFLGVRLREVQQNRILKKVLITSTMPQEGKSMVAANLACTLARKTQQRILLLEGDLRSPSLSQMFGLGGIPGLCEWLQGDRGPVTSIYHLEEPGFWILPAGSSPRNPLETLLSG